MIRNSNGSIQDTACGQLVSLDRCCIIRPTDRARASDLGGGARDADDVRDNPIRICWWSVATIGDSRNATGQ